MSAPNMLESTIRTHDVAFYDWLGGLVLDYGEDAIYSQRNMPILRIFASPSRAWAKLVNLLVSQQFVSGADAQEMQKNAGDFAVLPLPVATIEVGDPVPDPELANVPGVFRYKKFNALTGQWEFHRHPAHYKCDYTVTIWAGKRYTANYVKEWIAGKLGNKGLAQDEFLLPVTHDAPWGVIDQKCQFTGSSDASNLEGASARYFRTTFTFSLRMWVMRPILSYHYPVERIGFDVLTIQPSFGVLAEEGLVQSVDLLDKESMNLFHIPASEKYLETQWPKTGNSTVTRSLIKPGNWFGSTQDVQETLKIEVTNQNDKVLVCGDLSQPADTNGRVLMGYSFAYRTNGNVEVEFNQVNPSTGVTTSVDSVVLATSPKWSRLHNFTLVDDAVFEMYIAGIPNQPQQTVFLHDVDVRAISPGTRIQPANPVTNGPDQDYVWAGLTEGVAYLIGLVTGATTGLNTVILRDDVSNPTIIESKVMDSFVNRGIVFLMQPKTTTISLLVPTVLTVADIFIQRYYGSYQGNVI